MGNLLELCGCLKKNNGAEGELMIDVDRQKEIRIVVLGLLESGKTAIYNKLRDEDIDYKKLEPTKGFNTAKVPIKWYEGMKMELWEITGNPDNRSYWMSYGKNMDGIIYVIDAGDTKHIDESISELKKLITNPVMPSMPILVYASKQDKKGAMSPADLEKQL